MDHGACRRYPFFIEQGKEAAPRMNHVHGQGSVQRVSQSKLNSKSGFLVGPVFLLARKIQPTFSYPGAVRSQQGFQPDAPVL